MSKKNWLLVVIIVLTTLIVVPTSIFFYLKSKNIYETSKITNEILKANKIIESEKINLKEIEDSFKTNLTSGSNLIIEKSVEEYLLNIVKSVSKLNSTKEYLISTNVTTIKDLSILENYKDEVNLVTEELRNSDQSIYIKKYTKDKEIIEKYNELLLNKINLENVLKSVDIVSTSIDKVITIASFLNTNESNYKVEEEKIIFLNRSTFELYKNIVDDIDENYKINIYDYKLIDDTVGPIIEADSISLLIGTPYDINSNVKCYDEVDGNLDCNITGNYNVNAAGSYNMSISSTDIAGNISTKDIVIKIYEPERPQGPYYIEIIRNYSTVIVYGQDSNGNYTNIVQVFPASVGAGANTPLGTFKTTKGLEWGGLYGGVWGQYSTRIVGSVLFHSVPYFSVDKSTLWWEEYNNLGTARSLGCIRLTVRDAKWIYDNCPTGTTVKIYEGSLPEGVEKPYAPHIDPNSPNRGWDPTDPDPNNPWNN